MCANDVFMGASFPNGVKKNDFQLSLLWGLEFLFEFKRRFQFRAKIAFTLRSRRCLCIKCGWSQRYVNERVYRRTKSFMEILLWVCCSGVFSNWAERR
jgi:hypothetical protein